MEFKFKVQNYQTQAVESVVDVFIGQPFLNAMTYTRDLGNRGHYDPITIWGDEDITGFGNAPIALDDSDLLANIQDIQAKNGIQVQQKLIKDLGRCSLSVEMETGTGKTYVYTRTIFELNKKYGWSKFIVVVPSIAIREGVYKSFHMTENHFMELYGKKIRFFIYDSKNLTPLDDFSSSSNIEVMIINIQAFNTEDEASRRIRRKLDEFQGRRPIDVISSNRPIMILDEPQKMGGVSTQKSLKDFNPLFCINYTATPKELKNLVYVLDAVDAYNERLVKQIEVKNLEVENLSGTNSYLYIGNITSDKHGLRAMIEFEINFKNSIERVSRYCKVGDNIFKMSNGMPQYKDYIIIDINLYKNYVEFANGIKLFVNECQGDETEQNIRTLQIRETIESHFDKEQELFKKGIKCLSLFFIDEVAKYKDYSKDDEKGEYARIFEREYQRILEERKPSFSLEYVNYLEKFTPDKVHNGYFSIDKKTNRMINPAKKRGEEDSNDISAYDLILRNKERLLSFDEPTRFIFSHSALREGWDNPNVFQICTLKHSDNNISRRQEVGRGLRICVDQNGDRVDNDYPNITNFFETNNLTVISTGSYADFVDKLQKEMKEDLYERPTVIDSNFFIGKTLHRGLNSTVVSKSLASSIILSLYDNGYVDEETDTLTQKFYHDKNNNCLMSFPPSLNVDSNDVYELLGRSINDETINSMIKKASVSKIHNELNEDNFCKEEFQKLWNQINHIYTYRANIDSDALIKKSVECINDNLNVSILRYRVKTGVQKENITQEDVQHDNQFGHPESEIKEADTGTIGKVAYDIIGSIASRTRLTRKTITAILKGINSDKFGLFKKNPEAFIREASDIINRNKASNIVNHITYNLTDRTFSSEIFAQENNNVSSERAIASLKGVQKYIITDGIAEDSVERRFAQELEGAKEVSVYAKLPTGFYINTPFGKHSPDWAIAFKEGSVKHIYFVAETKGTSGLGNKELRDIEDAKTKCAKKVIEGLSDNNVHYGIVNTYRDLLDLVLAE